MTWDPETPDAALLQAWRDGDKTAADLVIRRHGPRLYNFFASKVGRGADELCQRALHDCLETRASVDEDGARNSLRAILFTAARRRLLDHYYERAHEGRRIDPLEHSMAELEPGLSEAVAAREDQRRLALALRQLPVDLQITLELHHWEGFTSAELGRVMEAPEDAIEARLIQARDALEGLLARDDARTEHTVEALSSDSEPRSR